ncbi:MAG: transglutaminase-like domain-containing protein [Clostridia bacterium]|nr:transglutaminase-like domain-containing protein [Clostridia bacterium]
MKNYLKDTALLNYREQSIVNLIDSQNWNNLNEFDKIGAIYDYVQNVILLGYNKYDNLTATQVIADGLGQCNTKATLLMALLRAVSIPCRLHGTKVTKVFQRSLMSKFMAKLAPPLIVHTWAEVYYNGEWLSLEGVITDKAYISGVQKLFPKCKGKFFDYAIAVKDFGNLQIDWKGENTTVQQQAVVEDLGVFDTPDEFYSEYKQTYRGLKKFTYENIGRKIMTKKVAKIRQGKIKNSTKIRE